jgi:hypothetical protein
MIFSCNRVVCHDSIVIVPFFVHLSLIQYATVCLHARLSESTCRGLQCLASIFWTIVVLSKVFSPYYSSVQFSDIAGVIANLVKWDTLEVLSFTLGSLLETLKTNFRLRPAAS